MCVCVFLEGEENSEFRVLGTTLDKDKLSREINTEKMFVNVNFRCFIIHGK